MKRKGSAIVLAVLLLSFFTAIALAVFYLGGKKGERAYLKVIGEEVSNDVDMGSSIAYYDAYVSEQFVRKGKVYETDGTYKHPDIDGTVDSYPALSSMPLTLVDTLNYAPNNLTPPSGYYYLGIRLSSYINYFASSWDHSLGDKYKPYVVRDTFNKEFTDSILAYRNWQEDETKINRLWIYDGHWDASDPKAITVGGYRLEKLEIVKDNDGLGVWDSGEDPVEIYPLDKSQKIVDRLNTATTPRTVDDAWLVRATYVKRIRLDGGSDIGEADFKMQAVHEAVIRFEDTDLDGSADFDGLYVDSGEAIEELIIEKM